MEIPQEPRLHPFFFSLAWIYPLWWVAELVVRLLPSAILAAHSRLEIVSINATLFTVRLRMISLAEDPLVRAVFAPPVWIAIVLAFVAAGVALLAGRRLRPFPGLFAILLGLKLSTLAQSRFSDERSAAALGLAGLPLVVAGLVAVSLPEGPLWRRLLHLLSTVFAPILLLEGVRWSILPRWAPPYYLLLLPTATAIAIWLPAYQTARAGSSLRAPFLYAGAGLSCALALFLFSRSGASSEPNPPGAVVSFNEVASGPLEFQRGVNFTAEWPDVYRSPLTYEILDRLPSHGINAIAIVPYGFTPLGQPVVRFGGRGFWERDGDISRLIAYAHSRGIKVLLKPQIWIGGGWPSQLVFSNPQESARWFADYAGFIGHYADLAAQTNADILSIGVEFTKLTPNQAHWRRIIGEVRSRYRGPLTYSANWGAEFESIQFWDALDYMGLNFYYPLPADCEASAIARRVGAVQQKFGKPLLLTEVGFPSVGSAPRTPWAEPNEPVDLTIQADCFDQVFRAFYDKPWLSGMYWWKVGTNGFGGREDRSHTPWGKPAMDVLSRWYLKGGR